VVLRNGWHPACSEVPALVEVLGLVDRTEERLDGISIPKSVALILPAISQVNLLKVTLPVKHMKFACMVWLWTFDEKFHSALCRLYVRYRKLHALSLPLVAQCALGIALD